MQAFYKTQRSRRANGKYFFIRSLATLEMPGRSGLMVPSRFKQNFPVLSLASSTWELMARIWPWCGVCLQAARWWEASCGMWESGWTAEVMQGMLNVSPAGRELRLKHKLRVLGIAECSRQPQLLLPWARRRYMLQTVREENEMPVAFYRTFNGKWSEAVKA